MTASPSDPHRPFDQLSDEELVQEFQHLKSETAQGETADRSTVAIDGEMRRRGLQPDREDVIPDDPPSNEANVKPAH